MSTHDLSAWKVENLRMTAFINPADQPSDQNWWQEVTGESPENRNFQPQTGVKQDEGAFAGGRLVLIVNPFRVDWLLSATTNIPIISFPTIGQLNDSLVPFVEVMTKWLKINSNLHRLAFGAIVLLPFGSVQECHKHLKEYFPLNPFDLENAQDFNYQINRPRISKAFETSDLKINRLSSWSVSTILRLEMPNTRDFLPSNATDFAVRLQLDINTVQDYIDFLPNDKLSEIFLELVELGKEIIQKGDIK